jgi:predicted phage tail protein
MGKTEKREKGGDEKRTKKRKRDQDPEILPAEDVLKHEPEVPEPAGVPLDEEALRESKKAKKVKKEKKEKVDKTNGVEKTEEEVEEKKSKLERRREKKEREAAKETVETDAVADVAAKKKAKKEKKKLEAAGEDVEMAEAPATNGAAPSVTNGDAEAKIRLNKDKKREKNKARKLRDKEAKKAFKAAELAAAETNVEEEAEAVDGVVNPNKEGANGYKERANSRFIVFIGTVFSGLHFLPY